jgi:hemin uptake protein HemP
MTFPQKPLPEPGLKASDIPPHAIVMESRQLFGLSQELIVRHAGHDYRLRITRQNKLILTK